MKKITSFVLLFILLQLIVPTSAQAGLQCKNLFETFEVSDRTPIDGNNEGAYFVAAINKLTAKMKSTPFGKKIDGRVSFHPQYLQSVSQFLSTKELDFSKLARIDIVLKSGASDKLRQKIRIYIENEIAYATMLKSTLSNFKLFFKLVQLANYPEAEKDWILQTFLENKLKSLEIGRPDVLIPIIIEQAETPHRDSFFKVIQESETLVQVISNDKDLILSSHDDPNSNISDLGINYTQVRPKEKISRELKLNGRKYTLEISYKMGEKFELYKRQFQPRLNEMWKDKELTGTVLIDTQFTNDGNWLVDEYKQYFKNQGFEFTRAHTTSIEEAFVTPFVNGKMDYLVTEHSGGLTVSKNPQILVGTRSTPKGLEKIQIIYSNPEDPQQVGDQLYTFDMEYELPKLIHIRNNNKIKTELIYINGQCFTAEELKDLANKVDSAYLTYIGPSSLAETFANSSASPLQVLISGIRQGLNYSDILQKMKKSQEENYEENSSETNIDENSFRLPHEPISKRVDDEYNRGFPEQKRIYTVKIKDDKNKISDVDFVPLNGWVP